MPQKRVSKSLYSFNHDQLAIIPATIKPMPAPSSPYAANHQTIYGSSKLSASSTDIGNLLKVGCMLNLIEDKRGKVQVNSVMPHNKADSLRPAIHDVVLFTVEDFQQNKRESFNMLSEGIRNMILRSKELEGMNTDMGDEANDIGDVPF